MRVCSPEVRTLQLGSLPGSTASEGHLDRALKDIINKEAVDKFAATVQTFLWVSACIIGG